MDTKEEMNFPADGLERTKLKVKSWRIKECIPLTEGR